MEQNLIRNLEIGEFFTITVGDTKVLYKVEHSFNIVRIGEIHIG